MTADPFITRGERTLSAALTLLMHAAFFALLVFGVTWQHKREVQTMVAELWASLPQPQATQPEEPAPAAEPAPQPPRAEPEALPRESPKPAAKPDIALREKKERERKAREQELLEKKRREQEQAQLAAQREREAREAEAKRLAQEQAEALKRLAQQQAAARAAEIEKYKGLIRDRIRRYIIEPPNLQGNPEAELDVVVLPGGEVLEVRTRKPSGQPAWDNAVERAIRRAQPLPLPPDPALFREFRELNLKFRPKE